MVSITRSLTHWLFKFKPENWNWIVIGHCEYLTEEMQNDYLNWLTTEEGRLYLMEVENE